MAPEPDVATFAGRLERAMVARDFKRADLARAIGMSYQNLRQLRGEMGAEFAVKAAQALRVRIEWLALGEGEMDLPAPGPSAYAMEIARWFDEMPDRDRTRGHALTYQMFRNGRWPRLEDLRPDLEPTQAPPPDQGGERRE